MRHLSIAAMEASNFSADRKEAIMQSGSPRRSKEAAGLLGSHAMLSLVNGALALEYALKAIYIHDLGRSPHGHDLSAIAKKLSRSTRDALAAEFEVQLTQDEIAETHIWMAVIGDHAGTEIQVPRGFEETLASWADTFKRMRYHYERSDHRGTHVYLGPLHATLHRHLQRVEPDGI